MPAGHFASHGRCQEQSPAWLSMEQPCHCAFDELLLFGSYLETMKTRWNVEKGLKRLMGRACQESQPRLRWLQGSEPMAWDCVSMLLRSLWHYLQKNPSQSQITIESPTMAIALAKLVITVAPQKPILTPWQYMKLHMLAPVEEPPYKSSDTWTQ